MPHVDDDTEGIRRVQREESPCQPQQVVVVVRPFCFSLLQDSSNGIFGFSVFVLWKEPAPKSSDQFTSLFWMA